MKTNNPEIVFTNSALPSLHRVINIPLCSRALTQPVLNVSSAANLLPCKLILRGAETSRDVGVCAQNALPAPRPCAPSSEKPPQNNPSNSPAVPTPQLCLLGGLFSFQPSVCRMGWLAKGKPRVSSCFSSGTVICEGNSFSPAIPQGLLGINHSSEAADARLGVEDPRNDFLPLTNAGKQRQNECN